MGMAATAAGAMPVPRSTPTASTGAVVYDDGAVRMFTLAAVLWGVVGMTVGVLIASQLTGTAQTIVWFAALVGDYFAAGERGRIYGFILAGEMLGAVTAH